MNDKQPKYFSIKELFRSDDYVIPIYQRNYEWGEPEITQLIQDIVDYLLKSKETKYYIGSLIVYKRKLGSDVKYEIIDGQQRLTTLTILLNVIKKEYPKIDLSWYKKLNLSFDSRKLASDTLSYLFNGKSLENKECNAAIRQGYNIAKKSLAKVLSENKLTIDMFCNYFFKKVIILRVLVPEDTDLNHYFEIMNTRGEQLEKHEILKAKMLDILEDDNLKYAFNLIWEATSNMERYVQYGFSVAQRNEIFGEDWNNLVDKESLYQKLQNTTTNQAAEESLTISQLLEKTAKPITENSSTQEESPDRFNSVINFSNFLLHILRIQVNQDESITDEKIKNIPLDDKRLLELFEPFLKKNEVEPDKNKEFVKQFGYNLLKGKFYFDKYIIKREFTNGTDHWSLKRLKRNEANQVTYVNTFNADNAESNEGINREILMLLSMFHVSSPALVYKHWLNASLKFVLEYSGTNLANDYKTYLEKLAKAFLYDRFLAKEPIDYFDIIYKNKRIYKNKCIPQDTITNKLNQGTDVENFIFNYLDYLLWQDYMGEKNYFKINKEQAFTDNRIKDFEFTFRSSVEHYYPQHPIIEGEALKGEDAKWLDNFGNLCLISSSKNSRLSNHMPAAKKEYYAKSPTIDSIKQRIMMEYEKWGIDQIKDHSGKMIEIFVAKLKERE
ncbi:MAG: hypothetical protein KatS3mg034_1656 [Vicingaceae bacterium]|nr:MAG: hypothetical protein KatS3mg034_1656 [Vicingaceae bacterium]